MIIIYTIILLLGSLPIWITLKRIRKYKKVKDFGNHYKAKIIHIEIVSSYKGRIIYRIHLNYKNLASSEIMTDSALTNRNYQIGNEIDIAFEKNNPKIYIMGAEKGYYPTLGFDIVLFAFLFFAIFMIHYMDVNGY